MSHEAVKAKHTPGPWLMDYRDANGSKVIMTLDNVPICAVHPKMQDEGNPSADPNAHLIAAAPDLLEMLEETVRYIGGLPTAVDSSYTYDWREMLDKARAAIAKAEGTAKV